RGRDADEPDRAGWPLALTERQRGVRERRSDVRRSGKRRAAREEPELTGAVPLSELQLEDDDSGAYPVGTETARDGVGVRDDRGAHGRIVADVGGERPLLAVGLRGEVRVDVARVLAAGEPHEMLGSAHPDARRERRDAAA